MFRIGGFMRRALVVGIDHYNRLPLASCVHDAERVGNLLERHDNGDKNFGLRRMLSSEQDITRSGLLTAVKDLFDYSADVALLYFAGHCALDRNTTTGHLITPDCEDTSHGVSLGEIVALASRREIGVKASVIILDCCNSGAIAEIDRTASATLAQGMTILTSCDRDQRAGSKNRNGVFTEIMIDALEGGAADIRGAITPSAIYTHIDQSLGEWDMQRPVYKANVREFITLRQVAPRVSDDTLRALAEWFPTVDHVYSLDPSYEPDIRPGMENDYPPDVREANQAIFAQLQRCNRAGLIDPVGVPHLYHAAMEAKGCRLTKLGAHYWRLAMKKAF